MDSSFLVHLARRLHHLRFVGLDKLQQDKVIVVGLFVGEADSSAA